MVLILLKIFLNKYTNKEEVINHKGTEDTEEDRRGKLPHYLLPITYYLLPITY
jgi:hypothetical protein